MSLSSSLWCFVHAAGQGFGKVMAHRHVYISDYYDLSEMGKHSSVLFI